MMGAAENRLFGVLRDAGKPPERQLTPDGSRLLLLPYGARLLGLFAPGSDANFLWTHPALASAASAAALFQSTEWHNTGGDRTWLAPEVDVFFPDFPRTEVWQVPPQLDPGNYVVGDAGAPLKLVADVTVRLSRSGDTVSVRIARQWLGAPNPLRYEACWQGLEGVEYAGYTQRTCLELLAGSGPSARVGLWNLLAVPNGGEVLIPTHSRTEPEIYSGEVAAADLSVTDHLVRFNAAGPGIRKIGVRAAASTGRLGYVYPCENAWALVVRNFTVNPSGEYIDVPWRRSMANDARGYSTQACSVRTGAWDYCELEHHLPAVCFETGNTRSLDSSQLWAFRGPRRAIDAVARSLLSSGL